MRSAETGRHGYFAKQGGETGVRGGGHRGNRMDLCGVADKAVDEQALKKGAKQKEGVRAKEVVAWRRFSLFRMVTWA